MRDCIMILRPVLATVLAGLLLASCTAHGQQTPPRAALPELSHLPYWKAYRSHSSHNAAFFRSLTFGRAFVYERPVISNSVVGEFVRDDGRRFLCIRRKGEKKYVVVWSELGFETHSTGAARTTKTAGRVGRSLIFYEPKSGALRSEYLALHDDPYKRYRAKYDYGWVQDSWPRVLADACPMLVDELPAGMAVNEKQTSRKLDELRRQDPDAPIRNFPGSQHTGPGRTGLAASGGKPTTTKEEVEAWMKAQEGNVLRSSLGNGYVFTEGWTENTEIWQLGYDGKVYGFGRITRKTDSSGQEWTISEIPGVGTVYYPIGYPLPLMSTGHRYPAWQLTDELIAKGEPVALSWMGERYSGHRFLFHNKTLTVVLPDGDHRTGRWRWTKGRLQVTVDGEEQHAGDIAWRDLARDLGLSPKVWTAGTPNTQ